jgi:PAS domain S-box-containing protein
VATDKKQNSQAYAAIHGLSEGTTEIARSDWLAVLHPEDAERLQRHREEAFREHLTEFKEEYRINPPSDEVRWIELRGVASYDSRGRVARVVGVTIDITERKRIEEHRDMLIAELDHRVKNIFATVSAVVEQTRSDASPADFAASVQRRVHALARTHELLSNGRWSGASLAEIVDLELAPYGTGHATVSGPDITLKKEAAQAVSMVVHELATNAAKYGALSSEGGRVSVEWFWFATEVSPNRLGIIWRESGGPPVSVPARTGYGTSVIRELLPHELGGTVALAYHRDGLLCRLEVPAQWVSGC